MANPVTHLEKTIAGEVQPVTHLEKVIAEHGGGGGTSGGIVLVGETTTALTDNATTNPITVNGQSYTAQPNDAIIYGNKEFLFDGTKWHEFGDLSGLASKDIGAMTGYVKAQTASAIATNDTLNQAIGKVEKRVDDNKSNISLLCDANGKKQLIPNFGILTNGSVTYTHNSDSTITITGSKETGTENYIDIVQKSYEDYGLKSGDTIQVVNRDSTPAILAIIFTSSTSASSPNYTMNGTNTYTLPENYTGFCIRLLLTSSSTSVNVTINPLVCNKALYDISSATTPYSMSNAELTAVKQNALSSAQLDAVNSGIDSTKVEQIETNKNNILMEQGKTSSMGTAGTDYIVVNNIRIYVGATEPTGNIPEGSLWLNSAVINP